MKTKLIFFGMLCFNLSFGQNRSISPIVNTIPPGTPIAPNEIFRFQPGNVTQLDLGSGFGFTADRWFSMGRVVTGTNTAYGLRFQLPNKAVTFGYQNITNVNPRIEWIDTGANIGDLEFRSANSFTSTASTLVATMKKNGNTIFGNGASLSGIFSANSKVVISNDGFAGLLVQGTKLSGIGQGILVLQDKSIDSNIGISAIANNGTISNIAIKGQTDDLAAFNAAIYGEAKGSGATWAGFFDGEVYTTATSYQSSDSKLKENVLAETSVLEKISKLKPVTYKYKEIKQLNLPKEMQHGFVAQDIETIFPELTKEISQPVFDKEGKTTENYRYKAVNYNGLISVLTAGIKELHEKVNELEKALAAKDTKSSMKISQDATSKNQDFFMEQNIPNPFADQTTIRYQLPNGTNTAAIIVFDLNGLLIKNYPINSNQSELTIKSSA